MTMLAEKISKATKRPPRVFALGAAVIQFGKDGGTLEEAMQIVAEAFEKLPGKGQGSRASSGHTISAQPWQTLADAAGQNRSAEEAVLALPPASASERERDGLRNLATPRRTNQSCREACGRPDEPRRKATEGLPPDHSNPAQAGVSAEASLPKGHSSCADTNFSEPRIER